MPTPSNATVVVPEGKPSVVTPQLVVAGEKQAADTSSTTTLRGHNHTGPCRPRT